MSTHSRSQDSVQRVALFALVTAPVTASNCLVYLLFVCVALHQRGLLTFAPNLCASLIPDSSVGKEPACNAGDPGSIPGLGRSAEEWIGYPLQYSWASLVAQLVKNLPAMQETWIGSLGWEDPWRRERLLIPVFWPGEFHGLYSPWGCKELDMIE